MIKVNLLESVTDRSKGVAVVEEKVTNPLVQTVLLGVLVFSVLGLAMVFDFVTSASARVSAERELETQKQIQRTMELVNKEQQELERKTKEIEVRIAAITKLRQSQQGPTDVLREVKARVDSVPGIFLESIEQKGGELTIKGGSPNEISVRRFGQTLEFSSGLFGNLSIETERKAAEDKDQKVVTAATINLGPKPEIVSFVIKVAYAGAQPQKQGAQNAQNSGQPQNNSSQTAQVAKR